MSCAGSRCVLLWGVIILLLQTPIVDSSNVSKRIIPSQEKNIQTLNEYAVVIDAGSTRTRFFIYERKVNGIDKSTKVCSMNGLTSYMNDLKGLSTKLKKCLEEASKTIPRETIPATPIFLGATAGMRQLNEVNKTASDAILIVVRDTIKEFSFKFTDPEKQARIITGAEEGTYTWVTSNYITGRLREIEEGNTVGTLEMGGASTQITFCPSSDTTLPENYSSRLSLFGRNYSLYTHSYKCFGANTAINQYRALLVKKQNLREIIDNPCGPRGRFSYHNHTEIFKRPCIMDSTFLPDKLTYQNKRYKFVGGGNNAACHSLVQELFNFSAPCPWGDKCSFHGTYQPDVYGKFYAIEAFYHQLRFMNLTESDQADVKVFTKALTKLCSRPWNEVKDMKTSHKSMLPDYCFGGHYMMTLLNKAFRFKDWSNISFVRKLNGKDVWWTYGYMIVLNGEHKGQEHDGVVREGVETLTKLDIILLHAVGAIGLLLHLFCIIITLCIKRCRSRKSRQIREIQSVVFKIT